MQKEDRLDKSDRLARLLNIEHVLYQNPGGIKISRIAELCGVCVRTTYRDLRALETELGMPIWEKGSTRGIDDGYYLPPIHFTVPEALNVFLASRLMLNYTRRYDPNIASIFIKLNSILASPLRDQVLQTLEWMRKQPKNEKHLQVLSTLAEAWTTRRKVKIAYRSLPAEQASERIVNPYFIEPVASGHASYLIGYCNKTNAVRTFKIERIEAIKLTDEVYDIPSNFNANEHLGSAWSIMAGGKVKTIKLKFLTPESSRIIKETIWHPSQELEELENGLLIMKLKVTDTTELLYWILMFGRHVEVLEPKSLRKEILSTIEAMKKVYEP